jgi:hypothetical protein
MLDEWEVERSALRAKCEAAKQDCASRAAEAISKLSLADLLFTRSSRRREIQSVMDDCVSKLVSNIHRDFDLKVEDKDFANTGRRRGPGPAGLGVAIILLGLTGGAAGLAIALLAEPSSQRKGNWWWQAPEPDWRAFALLAGAALALAAFSRVLIKSGVKRLQQQYGSFVESELERRILARANHHSSSVYHTAADSLERRTRSMLDEIT